MKNILKFTTLGLLLVSCVPQGTDSNLGIKLKKALIRSRTISTVSTNVDGNNPAYVDFYGAFENQLVELNLEVSPIATTSLTVLNNNGEESKSRLGDAFYGEVDIVLNGTSITSCLRNQCQSTNCSNVPANDLAGAFKTSRIYLNLSRISQFGCPANLINQNHNELKIIHVKDNEGPQFQGLKIRAQVIAYNLTNSPQGMKNVVP